MRSLIEIPLQQYQEILANCALSDGVRSTLENGIVLQADPLDGSRRVAILCDSDQARTIIDLATSLNPAAALHIQEFTALNED